MRTQIQIIHGSILDADAQVIVNAANSHGMMGGGIRQGIRISDGESYKSITRPTEMQKSAIDESNKLA